MKLEKSKELDRLPRHVGELKARTAPHLAEWVRERKAASGAAWDRVRPLEKARRSE